jgi:hypothetical protein
MLDRGLARERASRISCEHMAALLLDNVTRTGERDCEASIRQHEDSGRYGT